MVGFGAEDVLPCVASEEFRDYWPKYVGDVDIFVNCNWVDIRWQ